MRPFKLASGICGLFSVRSSVRSRIGRLASGSESSRFWNLCSLGLIAVALVVGLTDSVTGDPSGLAVGQPIAATQDAAADNLPEATVHPQQDNVKPQMAQTLTIAGTCMAIEGESTIPGVELTLFEVLGAREQIRQIAQTTSDRDGKYAFTDLPPTNLSRVAGRSYLVKAVAEGRPDVLFNFDHNFDMVGWAEQLRMHAGTGSIKGRVTDAEGNPLVGATVQRAYTVPASNVGLNTATTNNDGLFLLSGMPLIDGKPRSTRGAYLQIHHPDYPQHSFQRQTLDYSTFVMTRGSVVEGSVVDAITHKPLVGIRMSAVAADIDFEASEGKAVTDPNGRFRMVLVEGNYHLLLEDDHYVATFHRLECRQGASIKLDPIQAVVGGWIVGQVINSDTNQPEVVTDVHDGQFERVGVGLFGPDRPIGKIIHTHWLDEVDDEGRFRLFAHPGENFPYLCNLRGSRMTWDTLKQAPVIVEAGKETQCDLTITPPRTPEQKMAKAHGVLDRLPKELNERIVGIIEEFRQLNQTVDECETWCLLMRELVRIGQPAVPALCKELDATDSPTMIRRLAFALRAIGDPRAVPALIRAIPKTLQPSMSDYGLLVDDPELTVFMQTHDLDEGGRGRYFDLGRPMREVYGALNKLTQRKQDVKPLSSIARSKDLRALARQEKIFDEVARQWVTWWESHWQQLGVGQAYSQVDLPEFVPRDTSGYPTGLSLTAEATLGNGMTGLVLTPVGDADTGADFLMDLDTGQRFRWPTELAAQVKTQESIQAARALAAKKGSDLMCVAFEDDAGKTSYALVGIELELWEISPYDAKKLEEFVSSGKLPEGRKLDSPYLLHRDPANDQDVSALGSSFMYVTQDQGIGVITLTDFVTTARDVTGMIGAPKGVGFHRGVKFNYHQIAR